MILLCRVKDSRVSCSVLHCVAVRLRDRGPNAQMPSVVLWVSGMQGCKGWLLLH